MLRVESLWVYPVKSCQGVQLTGAVVEPTGFALDRQFCVVGLDEESATQSGAKLVQDMRVRRRLATIKPTIDGASVILEAPAEAEAGRLSLHADAAKYGDAPVVMVSDRHESNWFGRPLKSRFCCLSSFSLSLFALN